MSRECHDSSARRAGPRGRHDAGVEVDATLVGELRRLREDMIALEREVEPRLTGRAPAAMPSLRNLLHYLALRRTDLRPLQDQLERRGLSSLGRAEAHALASVSAVLEVAERLRSNVEIEPGPDSRGAPSFDEGYARLAHNACALLGPEPEHRAVRVMVTMPSEAALDHALVRELVCAGMNLVRINCAHDDPDVWRRRIDNVRAAAREAGRPCLVEMELGGPKLRVGEGSAVADVFAGEELVLARRASGSDPRAFVCSLPEVLDDVRAGERIFFDDGKIAGVIQDVGPAGARVLVTQTKSKGGRIGPGRGINLPDSPLRLPALTRKDREDLAFAVKHADLVGMSFVQQRSDIEDIEHELAELAAPSHLGMLLKIETQRGFANLPRLLLEGVGRRPVGVMIARGDLAVECGYERLAEVQEEILWLCEAAHVPVVWATQVLERLAKKGLPTRAEITDAAMGERAECVMLNKGPHIVEALGLLDGILQRMHAHQRKKSARLRPLSVSRLVERD